MEVMGLVVLPKRLKEEMNLLKEVLLNRKTEDALNEEPLLKHRAWGEDAPIKIQFYYKEYRFDFKC